MLQRVTTRKSLFLTYPGIAVVVAWAWSKQVTRSRQAITAATSVHVIEPA